MWRIRIHNTQCPLYAPLEDDVVGLREQLHQVVNLGDVHAGVDPVELELAPQHPAYLLALPQPHHDLEFNKARLIIMILSRPMYLQYSRYRICITGNIIMAQINEWNVNKSANRLYIYPTKVE
jgi:hypothetical protein